jgi:RNA polymerase-binding transcription factor DksA
MTEINLDSYAKQLQTEYTRIVTQLEAIAHHRTDTDDWEAIPDTDELNEADSNVEADAVEEWNERRATVAALETEYRDIKRALAKVAAGSYGTCELCGQSIEAARLNIKPTARTCVNHINDEGSLTL